jgi:hypothetical protein
MMITLNSEKTPEQILELLGKQTRAIKTYHYFLLIPRWAFLWKLQGNVLAGKIKNNEFYLILLNKHMVGFPDRFFCGKVINVDNKTIIEGKFKLHPFWLTYYLIIAICILAAFAKDFWGDALLLITFFIICLTPLAIASWLKTCINKDNEEATIERIKEIIAE